MTESLRIRPANVNDVEGIVAFNAAMAWETENHRLDPSRLRQGVLALLTTPAHGLYFVAERQEANSSKLVGQLMITFEWSDWRNGVFWWIQSVYVHPTHRRKGIFRALQQHIVDKAKADPQVCGIRLYVEQTNHHAQMVYQRVGIARSRYTVFEQDFVLSGHTQS